MKFDITVKFFILTISFAVPFIVLCSVRYWILNATFNVYSKHWTKKNNKIPKTKKQTFPLQKPVKN